MTPIAPKMDLQHRRRQTETFLELARVVSVEYKRTQDLLEQHGLTAISPAQSRALMILFQAREPLTARELSRRMGLSEVTVSRFVKALTAAEWVGRTQDPDDRRAWLLRPTAKARQALPRFVRVANTLFDELFDGLSPHEVEGLAGIVTRIRANMDATLDGDGIR